MMGQKLTADALIVLLKHPLCHSAGRRGDHLRLTRELELTLRREGPAFPTAQMLRDWGAGQNDPFAAQWAECLATGLSGLALPPMSPLAQAQAQGTLHLAEVFANGTAVASASAGAAPVSELWHQEAGRNARALFVTFAAEAAHGAPVTPPDYLRLFETLIHQIGQDGRESLTVHPHITILGPREARETDAQRVILVRFERRRLAPAIAARSMDEPPDADGGGAFAARTPDRACGA